MRDLGKLLFCNGGCLTYVIALAAGCSFKIKQTMYLHGSKRLDLVFLKPKLFSMIYLHKLLPLIASPLFK